MKNPRGPDTDNDGLIDPQPNILSREDALNVAPVLMIGDSGLRRAGGYLVEEFLTQLRGPKGNKVFREMRYNDAICGAVMTAFSTLIRQVKWNVEPANDTQEAKDLAEFVEDCLFDDMESSWGDFMSEVSTMFTFGFAPVEMVFKVRRGPRHPDPRYRSLYDDGKVGIRKLALRAQYSVTDWDFTSDGYVRGFTQQTAEGKKSYIPMERAMLFRTEAVSNNPEGHSLLRNAYRSWFFKNRIEGIEAIGAERDLAGLPVLRIPSAYMAADADTAHKAIYESYKKMVTQIVRDENEGIVLPSDRDEKGELRVELTLLSTGGTRQFDTSGIINRYNMQIATAALADFILLGQRQVGSFALSDNKTDMFKTSLGTYLDVIEEEINRKLINLLWEYNAFDPDLRPELEHEDVDAPSLEVLGNFVRNVTQGGAMGDIDLDLVNAFRGAANLPKQVKPIDLPAVHPENAPKPAPGAAPKAPKKKVSKSDDLDSVETRISRIEQFLASKG